MASIEKRTGANGKATYRVDIRLKGHAQITKSFGDIETAQIFAKYKEMTLRECDKFDASDEDLYTLRDVLVSKYSEGDKSFRICLSYFEDFLDKPLRKCGYEELMDLAVTTLNSTITVGGRRENGTGVKKKPEIGTIIRRFAYLSSAINSMIHGGVSIDNPAIKVVRDLKTIQAERTKH